MADVRAAYLKGRRQASRLHRRFDMIERIQTEGGGIDVFDTIVRLGVPLIFKPLDGLLGMYTNVPMPGIMVTTKRSRSVQRYTGAHELGHHLLNHDQSLDDDLLLRRSPVYGRSRYTHRAQEFEADIFATEFLLPPWLIAAHCKRQHWTPAMLADPEVVYQLSLRVGASYEATCRALMRPGVEAIDRSAVDKLLAVQPRAIKKALLGEYSPPDWARDVWLLTECDQGTRIEGSSSDLFVFKLMEHSGSGYVWNFDEFDQAGIAVVRDAREGPAGDTVGGHVTRSVLGRPERPSRGRLTLTERRPWVMDGPPIGSLSVNYALSSPETQGLSQAERRFLAEAA